MKNSNGWGLGPVVVGWGLGMVGRGEGGQDGRVKVQRCVCQESSFGVLYWKRL